MFELNYIKRIIALRMVNGDYGRNGDSVPERVVEENSTAIGTVIIHHL
jgi:hypothetical protein